MNAIILALAAQTFLWPWHQPYHHRWLHHPAQTSCARINAVAKSLPPDRYEHALDMATEEERRVILNCAGRGHE